MPTYLYIVLILCSMLTLCPIIVCILSLLPDYLCLSQIWEEKENVFSKRMAIDNDTVQFSSVTQSCPNLCDPMDCVTPGFLVHYQCLELAQTHVHQVGDAIKPSHPLLSTSPPISIFPSIRIFPKESVLCIRWPKYWRFSFNISPSNAYSGMIFFRMDWLDLLAVQGTLKSLLQHHSSKVSILWCSASFIVQLSHPYMTTGKR